MPKCRGLCDPATALSEKCSCTRLHMNTPRTDSLLVQASHLTDNLEGRRLGYRRLLELTLYQI